MESVERKDASAGPEEPIKSEGMVPSPDTSERSNGASSPPPNCSICLGKLINTSFTDSCLHQFCFTCLLQWSKIKTECPLCKQTFKSIIHNVRSEEDYDQYHVQYTSQMAAMLDVTTDVHISGQLDLDLRASTRPFMYRTTMGNNNHHRLLNPQAVARREQIPSIAHQVSSEERRLRNTNPLEYRRRIYRTSVWATPLPDAFGRFRECSADYYRRNPLEIHRIIPWINRELQVLTNNQTHHIAYVMHVLTDILTLYDINSIEFLNAVRPFFGDNTEQFAHELANFARTNFDLVGYDQAVTYLPNRGLSNEYVPRLVSPPSSSSSSSSSDSDVQIVQYNSFQTFPGPSTVGQGFRLQMPYRAPDVLTISSTSSSSENDCAVVGYVKPRHERTPEIIDLSSSEAEEINSLPSTSNNNVQSEALIPLNEEVIPSTSSSGDNNASRRTPRRAILAKAMAKARMYGYLGSTSESDSEETDSDYNPANTKSRRHKSSKKSSKISPRKLRSRKRKKSIGAQQKQRIRSYSSCDSENESPQLATSSSRGLKRYLSKSSEGTDCEKVVKKSKKSKKSKSTKKSKKRVVSSKANCRSYSSSCSSRSSSGSNSEVENAKSNRRQKKKKKSSAPLNSYSYSSEEHSANEASKRLSKKSSEATEPYHYSSEEEPSTSVPQVIDQRKDNSSKFPDSDYSDYHRRSMSSRPSSSESFGSRKNHERLQNSEADNNKHCSSEEADRSVYSDEASSSNAKRKACSKPVIALNEELSDKYGSPNAASTSGLSSKSDASSLTEHSASSKTSSSSRGRHRSHKKRKDSKKRRRSRS